MINDETSHGVRSVLSSMRQHNRRTVIQAATLKIGSFNFDCTAYDISLGGIRLKVDMPIEKGTNVLIQLKNKLKQTAQVIWFADGFMGLSFTENPEKVRSGLGNLANGLS
ncbi:MAG: PilZ domain-containing protein [Emcibacter sp.]|nr:PilZ domain-containing protein [Emcibacter sp.]MBL4893889.1 PilZ domain-containing protein [Emcibacter sp.]